MMQDERDKEQLWQRLQQSTFRCLFALNPRNNDYLRAKSMAIVLSHTRDFIASRLVPALPAKDGKQTPWRGHPVFVAQHATATFCRCYLERWYGIPRGVAVGSATASTMQAAAILEVTRVFSPGAISATARAMLTATALMAALARSLRRNTHSTTAERGIDVVAGSSKKTGDRRAGRDAANASMAGKCAAMGLLLAIAIDVPTITLLSFLLLSFGTANLVPLLFSAASDQRDMPPHLAQAAVSGVGYAGLLTGPALIDFIAHLTSLYVAFGYVAVLLLLVSASARRVTD